MTKKQYYKESKLILEEVKKAKRIMLNCHRAPDPDSIGSALAMYEVLKMMNKSIDIVCPSEELCPPLSFLDNYEKIKSNVDFSIFDFGKYDLLIIMDSSSWDMVTGDKNLVLPETPIAVIDHHKTNTRYGKINLVDIKTTSVGEMMYKIFCDWGVKWTKNIAENLMAAIIGDTGAFRFPKSTYLTFEVASKLIKLGADKDKIIQHVYRSEPFELLKFYGEALKKMKIDKKYRFVWTAIPYEIYEKLDKPLIAREATSSLFAQSTEGTDFGFVAVEHEKGITSVSFRSRTGVDTSKMAMKLGGGGHVYASGAKIEAPFKEAVNIILKTSKEFVKQNSQ